MDTRVINAAGEISKERLMQDLRVVVSDAEELLRATAAQTGEKASAARERIQESLVAARANLASAQETVAAETRQAAKVTDEYVQKNPWKAVGIATGVSLVVGMLIARGR